MYFSHTQKCKPSPLSVTPPYKWWITAAQEIPGSSRHLGTVLVSHMDSSSRIFSVLFPLLSFPFPTFFSMIFLFVYCFCFAPYFSNLTGAWVSSRPTGKPLLVLCGVSSHWLPVTMWLLDSSLGGTSSHCALLSSLLCCIFSGSTIC